MEEDPLADNPATTPFEKDKVLLRGMQGGAIAVDLDWYPEQYENQEPDNGDVTIILDRETFECQAMACVSMSEIQSIDEESVYKKMTWNEEMANHHILLIPVEIHKVQGPTGYYHRFWGYISQTYPDSDYVEVKKTTISLPSGLSKRIAAFSEDMLNMKADPLEDSKVYMILTTYHGLEEFEVKDEKRKSHKFWNTRIVKGHRSP